MALQLQGLNIEEKYLLRFDKNTNSKSKIQRYAFNPDLKKDGYMPKVTIKNLEGYAGLHTNTFEIEGSAPKILCGANYFGVDESDYDALVGRIATMLQDILNGYPITKERIERANLRTIAFCFNFVVSNSWGNLTEFIKKVSLLDVGKNYKHVKNDIYFETETGYCIRFYNKQISIKIYDKTAEVINNQRKTPQEETLARTIKQGLVPFRILRMEITLQNKTALKKYFAARTDGDAKRERTLKEAFSNKLCQGILLQFFERLANGINIQALDMSLYPLSDYLKITKRAGMQPYDAYAWLGRTAATQQAGSLQLKLISDDFFSKQDRFRNDKRFQKLLVLHPLPQFTLGRLFEECRKQLLEFKIMKPGDIDLTSMPSTP